MGRHKPGRVPRTTAVAVCESSAPRGTPETGGRRPYLTMALLSLLVAAAVLFAHWPELHARALSFDDDYYLVRNPLVQQPSWASARQFLTEVLKPSTVMGYYQPLAMISLMLDYAMAGSAENLAVFHRTSLILHLANTLLVMWLVYALLGRPWIAAGTALLFGVHPMTVESIAWVGERKTVLSTFFAFLSLLAYVRHTRTGGWRWYIVCSAVYILALLSKPTSIALPLVMLLLDYWPLRRFSRRSILEKVPLLAIAGAFAVITMVSQARSTDMTPTPTSAWQAPLILCYDLAFYPCKMLWPRELTSHYPIPKPLSFSNHVLLATLLAVIVVAGALIVLLRWTRAPITGFLIFALAVLPTTGIIGFTTVLVSDKYAYLPAVGYLLIVAWLLALLAGDPPRSRRSGQGMAVAAGVLLAAGLLTWGTRSYLREWESTERHDQYLVRLAPKSHLVYWMRAFHRLDAGHYALAREDMNRALELKPDCLGIFHDRGIANQKLGDSAQAIQDFQRAIEFKPADPSAWIGLGSTYCGLGDSRQAVMCYARAVELGPEEADAWTGYGDAHSLAGDFSEAIRCYSRALEIKPDAVAAYVNRGNAYARMGNSGQALADYGRAIELKPRETNAYYSRAGVRRLQGNPEEAIRDYTRALELDPADSAGYLDRANVYAEIGDFAAAIRDCDKAVELSPQNPAVYIARAGVRKLQGDLSQAVRDYDLALQRQPDNAQTLNDRGNLHCRLRNYEEGIRDYSRAIELKPVFAEAYQNRAIARYALKDYGRAWADVAACQRLGGQPNPMFLSALRQAASQPNAQ